MGNGEAGVFLSTGAIAMIGALLTSLVGAIGILFRSLVASKDAQIARLAADNERLFDIAFKQATTNQKAVMLAERARGS